MMVKNRKTPKKKLKTLEMVNEQLQTTTYMSLVLVLYLANFYFSACSHLYETGHALLEITNAK